MMGTLADMATWPVRPDLVEDNETVHLPLKPTHVSVMVSRLGHPSRCVGLLAAWNCDDEELLSQDEAIAHETLDMLALV
jgi:hypothetical protein